MTILISLSYASFLAILTFLFFHSQATAGIREHMMDIMAVGTETMTITHSTVVIQTTVGTTMTVRQLHREAVVEGEVISCCDPLLLRNALSYTGVKCS